MTNYIRIKRFWTGTEKVADPDNPVVPKIVPVDWVEWEPKFGVDGSPPKSATVDKVRRLDPENVKLPEGADGGEKLAYMRAIWSDIEPAYQEWKTGRQMPASGTPLAVWPILQPEDIEILNTKGYKTVEDVRDMTSNQIAKLPLANAADLHKMAPMFLEGLKASANAEREAEKDAQIADMAEQIRQLQAHFSGETVSRETIEPINDDEMDKLRNALEGMGVKVDRRWGADRLREEINKAA